MTREDALQWFWGTFGKEGWQAYQRGFFALFQWYTALPEGFDLSVDLTGRQAVFRGNYGRIVGVCDLAAPTDSLLTAILAHYQPAASTPCSARTEALDYPWPEPGEPIRPPEVSVCPEGSWWRRACLVVDCCATLDWPWLAYTRSAYCDDLEVRCETP
jgi:hypothetical protein